MNDFLKKIAISSGIDSKKSSRKNSSPDVKPNLIEVKDYESDSDKDSDEKIEKEKSLVKNLKTKLTKTFSDKMEEKSLLTKRVEVIKQEEDVDCTSKVFSRVSRVSKVNSSIFDQNYKKKLEIGGEDDFGQMGHDKLNGTQGKEFRKQKNKMKKRELQGGKLTLKCNLIDL